VTVDGSDNTGATALHVLTAQGDGGSDAIALLLNSAQMTVDDPANTERRVAFLQKTNGLNSTALDLALACEEQSELLTAMLTGAGASASASVQAEINAAEAKEVDVSWIRDIAASTILCC
jgi:hypothetical protein|tara:strand:- start:1390 stop:1749 length:360 start_codon:yes stop_codon:yes gene_type:complete